VPREWEIKITLSGTRKEKKRKKKQNEINSARKINPENSAMALHPSTP
jgi:hypothetical protein